MCEEYNNISWLPDLVLFDNYDNNWNNYLEALYRFFKSDFIENRPVFKGFKLNHKRHPLYDNKETTFWHMISEGSKEDERIPDFRRCERIRWSKAIIENFENPRIKIWKNIRRRNEERILIWYEDIEYLIVLADRKDYILFWTAYPVIQRHTKFKLNKEYIAYKKANAAS